MKVFKKSILILCIGFGFQVNQAYSSVFQKGDLCLDLYYGSPSVATLYSKLYLSSQEVEDFSFIGPFGFQGEFFLTNRIAVGLDANYSYTFFQAENAQEYIKYDYIKYRVMPRFSIHLGNSSVFDNYFSIGVGYKYANGVISSNVSDQQEVDTFQYDLEQLINFYSLPFALRIAWGCKYFVTNNLGLSLNAGLGGGTTISGGLAYKISLRK